MYRSRHITADYEVFHSEHDTLAEAEDFARTVLAEMGGHVEICTIFRTLWAETPPRNENTPAYNGVRPGDDFPGTLFRR